MLTHYAVTAVRALRRRASITALNLAGLATGIAAVLLIALWVEHERSYDAFHPGAERIARVAFTWQMGDQALRGPVSPSPMARTLATTYPAVEAATRLRPMDVVAFRSGARSVSAPRVLRANADFFNVFGGFEIIRGAASDALSEPGTVVVTASLARQLFRDINVVGRSVEVRGETRQVSAVMQDVPAASHLQFDAVLPLSLGNDPVWIGNNDYTYLKLRPGTTVDAFEPALDEIVQTYAAPLLKGAIGLDYATLRAEGGQWAYHLQPLLSIHLSANSEYELQPGSSRSAVYAFLLVGLCVLLIAAINFMNLSTARATERAAEVSMRKVLGANRSQLARQFLGEAVLTTVVAAGIAVGIAAVAAPFVSRLAGAPLTLSTFAAPLPIAAIAGAVLLLGGLSGLYPAAVLARSAPGAILPAGGSSSHGHGRSLRRGLVVLQFALSVAMIAATLVIDRQFEFIQTKPLGLEKDHVVMVPSADNLEASASSVVERLEADPSVQNAATGSGLFDGKVSATGYQLNGGGGLIAINYLEVSEGFVDALGIEVVAGRGFDASRSADASAVLINRAAAERFGWTTPNGQTLTENGRPPHRVIGVVENFHYQSLRQRVEPLVLHLRDNRSFLYARVAPGALPDAVERLETIWTEAGGGAFSYRFLDQTFAAQHRATQRTGQLFGVFTGLGLFIACLGLFGLAAYTVDRRTKEIGIRKALGATVPHIVGMISGDVVRLIGIAFLAGGPLAYLAMRHWLDRFAYRIDLGAGPFLLTAVVVGVIALLTVSTQAYRAARLDPVTTIRDE